MLNTLYHERLMQGYAPDNCDLGVIQRALAMLTNNGLGTMKAVDLADIHFARTYKILYNLSWPLPSASNFEALR